MCTTTRWHTSRFRRNLPSSSKASSSPRACGKCSASAGKWRIPTLPQQPMSPNPLSLRRSSSSPRLLVFRVIRGARCGYVVHFIRPHLEFDKLSFQTAKHRVDALIAVLFRARYVVFVPLGEMPPQFVEYLDYFPAVFFGRRQYAEAVDIVDIIDAFV